ncbi:hypothetical protein I3842_02G127200 [Carya illinoinensis]|uniref:Uncharacterized protein n=1 Tax=Carya illinoinensis TaxID=32201 RepID=A0A922K3K7_CARIL|nr:hypothetical protein I3842_02G127200 [Carya illinoinensis]
MAGIAIVLDLLRKKPSLYTGQSLHSYGLLSATAAASAAAAAVSAGTPFASRALFGSFLMFYLPLLEPHSTTEDDDDEFLQDTREESHVDLVIPFKKSMKQIIRETTVVTTRRVLERIVVHYVSQRMAWKLLKDVPKSAVRKSARRMPTLVYFFSVSRTTFRGHFLGVAASWLVQVGIEIYRYFGSTIEEENDDLDKAERVKVLGKKVAGATVRCSAALVFASIGAGIGATLLRPSAGQWIGCAVGDLAGPIIVSVCLEKVLHVEL